MQTNEKIYQSILHKISIIPPSHLQELDIYLQKLVQQVEKENQPMSLDKFNMRIEQSMEDSKNGLLTSHSELKSKIEKWN
jgi:hypothetical protein